MDEIRAGAGAGVRDVLGPRRIDGVGPLLVLFGGVDLGVRGAVHHDVTGLDETFRRRRIGDIPLRRRQRQHVAALPTGLSCQEAPHHATGAGDNDSVRHALRVWHADLRYRVCARLASSLGRCPLA